MNASTWRWPAGIATMLVATVAAFPGSGAGAAAVARGADRCPRRRRQEYQAARSRPHTAQRHRDVYRPGPPRTDRTLATRVRRPTHRGRHLQCARSVRFARGPWHAQGHISRGVVADVPLRLVTALVVAAPNPTIGAQPCTRTGSPRPTGSATQGGHARCRTRVESRPEWGWGGDPWGRGPAAARRRQSAGTPCTPRPSGPRPHR
jgi:hypothetical protein